MNVPFNKERRYVQKGMTDWRTQNIWSDGEQGRIQDMQEDTQKRDNETGSITQTGQLDIKWNEDRGYVFPLRAKKEL